MADYSERNQDGTFKKGHSGAKPEGAISEKTRIWNEISEWFKGDGLQAYQQELMQMKDDKPSEFLKRYETMLEYFAPKLSRTEVDASVKQEPDFDPSKYTDEELEKLESLLTKGQSRTMS